MNEQMQNVESMGKSTEDFKNMGHIKTLSNPDSTRRLSPKYRSPHNLNANDEVEMGEQILDNYTDHERKDSFI